MEHEFIFKHDTLHLSHTVQTLAFLRYVRSKTQILCSPKFSFPKLPCVEQLFVKRKMWAENHHFKRTSFKKQLNKLILNLSLIHFQRFLTCKTEEFDFDMDGEKAPICYKEITTALRQWILPTFVSLPWGFSVFGGAASKFSSEHNNTSLRYTCFPVFSFKYGNMVNIDL